MGKKCSAWLLVLLLAASYCASVAQEVEQVTAATSRTYWHGSKKCESYKHRHGKYPRWCKPRPLPPPSPQPTEDLDYRELHKNATLYHWSTVVRPNMYPTTHALEEGRGQLVLFTSDFGQGSLKTIPPLFASGSTLKPATDDIVKAGVKAGQTAVSNTAKFVLDCVTKEACAKVLSTALGTIAKKFAETFPAMLNIGVPFLGTAIQVLVALFWPDTTSPPPLTVDQVKDLIDKKVIEASNKIGNQLLSSIALYTDATIGEAVANIEIETAQKALGPASAITAGLQYYYSLPPCAKYDPDTNDCLIFNQELFASLQDLTRNVIPSTKEKIFPADLKLTDYAAARRIPYLVTLGQLALPILFQWAWMAEGMNSNPNSLPPSVNYRLNAQLRQTIIDILDAIDSSIAESIERRTEKDMRLWFWDGTTSGTNLPFECGNTVEHKSLRWCLTDTYPGGAGADKLVIPFQGVNENDVTVDPSGDPHNRFLMFRRVGMPLYAQSIRWGITTPLLYASLTGAAAPARTWGLWGVDLRFNITNNATAKAAITPVWKLKVAHVGPFGGSCTFQAVPWWLGTQGCTPTLDVGLDDSQYYLCLQCVNNGCNGPYNRFCGTSSWCSGARSDFGHCHRGRMAADYTGGKTQEQLCGSGFNAAALSAQCKSANTVQWVQTGCGVPAKRLNEVNTHAWSMYRKCYMSVPGPSQMCHNSFVNGKATVEDIYTSDQSKWVSESVKYGYNAHWDWANTGCDCDVSPGDRGYFWHNCGYNEPVAGNDGFGHDYECRRYLAPLNYPDALTPSQDKLAGFEAGGKFPFNYQTLGNITSVKMGFVKSKHMFHYVSITYQNGQQLVTPDYARDFSKMAKFDSLGTSWCDFTLKPGQLVTGAVGVHDMAAVHGDINIYTNVAEKSFVMRGITWVVSNVNESDWSVTPAFNVTCGDAPGSPSIAPDEVNAGAQKTFIPSAPEGGYGLIDNEVVLNVDAGADSFLCHVDVLGIYGDEVDASKPNWVTGFKFSWCWYQLELPGKQDWEDCVRNGGNGAGGAASCSPNVPVESPSPPPPNPKPSPSPAPPVNDCTAVNYAKCPTPVLTNSSRYCSSIGKCTCYVTERQVSGCDPPACYDTTKFDCADTTDDIGYQTLSPCGGPDCPDKCSNSGAPWDQKCRPGVGK